MRRLVLRMLFRKKGTASAILAIALLIALIASVNLLLNNITAQTRTLSQLASTSETYLIVSKNATALSDSQIDSAIINQIRSNADIDYAVSQQITKATLTTALGNYSVNVRGVYNLQAFLKNNQAYLNGSISQNQSETNIGIILSKLAAINLNDTLTLIINEQPVQLKVAGIIQTTTQSDSELIMPLSTLQALTQKNATISYIEFSLKDQNKAAQTLNNITQTLPPNTKVMQTQQLVAFAQDINNQTIAFINLWSTAIYVVVIAASYIMAARLVNEAEYELCMLRNLGAKKKVTLSLILIHTLIIAFVGSVIGIAVGIVGTQMAATGVRWVWGNSQLAPFLQPQQALQILLIALASSMVGSVYPAINATKAATRETPT
jgi:ABC-type lipoprotein release transport system permease subunit